MKKTWLIANFELATGIATAAVSALFSLIGGLLNGKEGLIAGMFGIPIVVIAVAFAFYKNPDRKMSIGFYLLGLGVLVFIVVKGFNAGFGWPVLFVASIPIAVSAPIAFRLARYAYNNIEDTIASRVTWQYDDYDMLQYRWKYAVNRFCVISICVIFMLALVLGGIIAFYIFVSDKLWH
jgi:hypothetical protein